MPTDDIQRSLERAAIRHDWVFDDRWSRIGNPFSWVDGERMPQEMFLRDVYGVLQYLSMYYETYETVDTIRIDDHDKVFADIVGTIERLVGHYFPFVALDGRIRNNIECTARTRTQDYAFLRTFCKDLPSEPVLLDIGPGLGSHAFYGLHHLGGPYIGVEASLHSYDVQRHTYRFLASESGSYCDAVLMETLGHSEEEIAREMANPAHAIRHLPSWRFDDLPDDSVDLITATYVLNEVAPAGVAWLMYHSMRVLRPGGYLYIRDSDRRKPNRHNLDYETALQGLGFEPAGRLDVTNRVDMFGIPRVLQLTGDTFTGTFDELFDHFFTRFAATVHQGEYMQNLPGMTPPAT